MTPIVEALAGLHWGWKVVGAFLGGVVTSLPILIGLVSGPVDSVHAIAVENTNRIESMEATTDTIRSDLQLVRCWVRHQIEGTDASVCIVIDGRR